MRHEDWQTRLSAFLDENRYRQFAFENHNCLFFSFGGIYAVTEKDLMPLYEGRASSPKAGALALRKVDGVDTVAGALAKHLRQDFQSVAFARPGDLVFIENENPAFDLAADLKLFGPTPGICYGYTSFFLGTEGLVEVPTMMADKMLWVS